MLHATRVEHVGSTSVPGLGGRPVIAAVVIAAVDTQPAIIADMSRAVGASDQPPVERIDWYLDVDADATPDTLEAIKLTADYRCPGAWCMRNPVELHTHLSTPEQRNPSPSRDKKT